MKCFFASLLVVTSALSLWAVPVAAAEDAVVTSGDMTGSNVMAIVCAAIAVAGAIYLWIIRRKR